MLEKNDGHAGRAAAALRKASALSEQPPTKQMTDSEVDLTDEEEVGPDLTDEEEADADKGKRAVGVAA